MRRADRLFAIGMGVFHSTGYHEDGTPYDRPGRTTVALSRRRIGDFFAFADAGFFAGCIWQSGPFVPGNGRSPRIMDRIDRY